MQLIWWEVLAGSLGVLGWLILDLKHSQLADFDQKLSSRLRTSPNPAWQVIAFINDPKLMVVWASLVAAILLKQNQINLALWTLATLGLTDLVGIVLKKLLKRRRPGLHLASEHGYSFPSGHVLGATSMALILLQLFSKQLGLTFVIAIVVLWLLIINSRLHLKAHYPSDILAATSLAIGCFSLAEEVLFYL